MLISYKFIGIFMVLFCSIELSAPRNAKDKLWPSDRVCTKTIWELRNSSLVINTTGVLKRGDGIWKIVHVEVIKNGLANVTSSTESCCDGYHETNKGKCKKCERGWYGFNCSEKCKCKRGQKCHRREGCIDKHKCKEDDCDDDEISTAKPDIATDAITSAPIYPSTTTTNNETTNSNTPTKDVETEGHTNYCEICKAAGNCKSDSNCTPLTAGRGAKETLTPVKNNTILIAVVVPLVVLTVALVACIVTRERYHRFKKQRNKNTVLELKCFDEETHPYVDPEPVYFEIKDEDIVSDRKIQNGNLYEKQHSVSSDSLKGEIKTDEMGYMSPYTPLRFARSETNLFKDRKIMENGEYDKVYSIAKPITNDAEPDKDNEEDIGGETDKDNILNSSYKDERSSDTPDYFVLEKTVPTVESDVSEKETLLKRSSRSSI